MSVQTVVQQEIIAPLEERAKTQTAFVARFVPGVTTPQAVVILLGLGVVINKLLDPYVRTLEGVLAGKRRR